MIPVSRSAPPAACIRRASTVERRSSLLARWTQWVLALLVVLLGPTFVVGCGGGEVDSGMSSGPSGGSSGSSSAGTGGTAGAGASGKGGSAGAAAGTGGTAGASGKGGAAGATGGSAGATGGSAGATGGASGGGGAATVQSVSITPAAATVAVGTTLPLVATAVLSDGAKQDVTSLATWTSASPTAATVTSGLVTAIAPGTVQITAAYAGKSGIATITVPGAKPKSLDVTPASVSLGVGASKQLTATLILDDGSSQDVTQTAAWTSGAPGVASVDKAGQVLGVTAGSTKVTAALGGLAGSSSVTVTGAPLVAIAVTPTAPVLSAGLTQPFVATGSYGDGSVADLTATATWASSDPGVVAIDAKGVGATLAPGTSIVSATVGSITGTTTVTVTAATVTSVVVAPAAATVAIKGTTALTATAKLSDGSSLDVTASAAWSASPSGVVSVSNAPGSQGTVTGVSAGVATVTAKLGGASGTATVTVTPAKLVSLAVTPTTATIAKGTTVTLAATGTYDDGAVTDETANVTWSSSDATIATVDNAPVPGVVTGGKPGGVVVTASLGGVTGTASVTVTAATVTALTVSPATLTLAIGKKENLKASATYTDGTVLDVTQQAVWTTADATIADVSNAPNARGLVSGQATGQTTITATFDGKSAGAQITVEAPALAMLVLSPIEPVRAAGAQQQFQAIAVFTNGIQQNVTAQAVWTSSDTSVATIGSGGAQSGQAKALASGRTTISATYQGLSGSTTLTVTAATLASISVSPIDPTFGAGVVANFQATAIFSDGTSQNVTNQATWSSSAPKVAAVQTNGGQKGRVTTLSAGTADISATYLGVTGASTVVVSPASVIAITVNPADVTGAVGTKVLFTAQAIYDDGTSLDVTALSTWTSSAPAVVDVQTAGAGKGLATAFAKGDADVRATYLGVTGAGTFHVTAATVTSISVGPVNPVTAPGVKVKLFATALLSDGTSQDATFQATWTSQSPDVADVSDALATKGLVTPLTPGDAVVTATLFGVSGNTTVTVTGAKLTTIQVTPFDPTLPIGYDTLFQAVGIYDDLSTQDLTQAVTWTSTAPATAAVSNAASSRGKVSPLSAGVATVQATYAGVTGSSKVTVTAQTLQSITVTPATTSLPVGQTVQLQATGDFGAGLVLDVTSYVTWLSSDTKVANVSNAPFSHGQAKALASGSAILTATRDGKTGQATLTVP